MLRDLAKSDKQHPALFLLALLPYFTPPKPPRRCCVLTAGAPVSHQWKFPEMSLWPWVIGRRLGVLRHRHTYRHTILSQTIVPSPHTTAVTPTPVSEGKIGPAMRVCPLLHLPLKAQSDLPTPTLSYRGFTFSYSEFSLSRWLSQGPDWKGDGSKGKCKISWAWILFYIWFF